MRHTGAVGAKIVEARRQVKYHNPHPANRAIGLMMQKYYKDWPLFETMPEGWKIDKTCGSPLAGYEFISDGKSPIRGGRRALVRAEKPITSIPAPERDSDAEPISSQEKTKSQQPYPARSVNELARQRFKLKMLADIRCDIMICEIEGWGKSEYLDEIKKLINSIGSQVTIDT